MSVERIERQGGAVWRVRWREGGRERSRVLGRKRDAEDFDAEVRRRRRTGALAGVDRGKITLDEFAAEWWQAYAVPNLAPSTRRRYAEVWDLHALPRLGGYPLRAITPAVVDNLRVELEAGGAAAPTVLKVMTIVSSVMSFAVLREEIPRNPVSAVRKPRQRSSRRVRPLTPLDVERLRARLDRRDATLVSVLAYAGLRPSEALGLRWEAIRDRTLLVEGGVVLGEERDTKTRRARTVRLLAPLAQDLAERRMACGRPPPAALVFPRADGGPWRETDYRNWRRRRFHPAAAAAGEFVDVRPYDLRHSFVSLLIHEGISIVEVARQAGHSPSVCLSTYAHVFDEFDPSERTPAEEQIRRARDELVSVECPRASDQRQPTPRIPL